MRIDSASRLRGRARLRWPESVLLMTSARLSTALARCAQKKKARVRSPEARTGLLHGLLLLNRLLRPKLVCGSAWPSFLLPQDAASAEKREEESSAAAAAAAVAGPLRPRRRPQ